MTPEEQLLEDGLRETARFHQRMTALGLEVVKLGEVAALREKNVRLQKENDDLRARFEQAEQRWLSLARPSTP